MTSYIRFLHASPDAPDIDVYDQSNNIVTQGLGYCDFTEYMPVEAGTYTIRCIPPGAEEPLFDTSCTIPGNTICTVAATGGHHNVYVLPISESPVSVSPDQACVRVCNLCTDSRGIDVYLSNSTKLASNLYCGDTSSYIILSPGTYTFTVTVSGTDSVILIVPNQSFYCGKYYTAYTVGGSGVDLQMLTPLDGISYIDA